MKIAFSAQGKDWDAQLDPRFGRAEGFLLYDEDKKELSWNSNDQNIMASQGAGIQAAQNVANLGAEALITGYAGPKAFKTLEKAGIKIYSCPNELTIREVYEKYLAGEVREQECETTM